MTKWVQKIEKADNRGDTKAIYEGVKSLSGSAAFSTTRPTEKVQRKSEAQQRTDPTEPGAEINETTRASGVEPKENHATVRASGEPETVRASGEPETVRASGESETVRASGELEAEVRAIRPKIFKHEVSTRINGPRELAQVWHQFLAEKFSATEMERLRKEFEALPNSEDEKELTREEFEEAVNNMKKGKAPGEDRIPAEVWKHSKVAKEALFAFLSAVWRKEKSHKTYLYASL